MITGASSGIGEALALALSPHHVTLILCARRLTELQRVADACIRAGAEDVLPMAIDVTDKAEVDRIKEEMSSRGMKLDILVNNAGISQRSLVEHAHENVERRIMELNFFAPVHLTRVMRPLFSKDAQVVVISSLSGLFGFPLRSTYSASKHALKGYFESWQVEQTEVGISLVFPGRIQSQISMHALHGDGQEHRQMDQGQMEGMPADVCAEKILRGVAKRRKKIVVGKKEKILYWFYRFIPPLYYKIASTTQAT